MKMNGTAATVQTMIGIARHWQQTPFKIARTQMAGSNIVFVATRAQTHCRSVANNNNSQNEIMVNRWTRVRCVCVFRCTSTNSLVSSTEIHFKVFDSRAGCFFRVLVAMNKIDGEVKKASKLRSLFFSCRLWWCELNIWSKPLSDKWSFGEKCILYPQNPYLMMSFVKKKKNRKKREKQQMNKWIFYLPEYCSCCCRAVGYGRSCDLLFGFSHNL